MAPTAKSAAVPNDWAAAERVILWYTPCWIAVVAVVVAGGLFDQLSAAGYVALGAALALPCFVVPAVALGFHGAPAATGGVPPWLLLNIWVAILTFWGNYAGTHYFYDVLRVRYTVPVDGFELNKVPIVMYLMTHPYFCSYHILLVVVLRKLHYATAPLPTKGFIIGGLAYSTAIMETWTISAFPHYTYPSFRVMLTVGSAFYSLFFLVTYPMFHAFWGRPVAAAPGACYAAVANALACCTLIYFAYEAWTAVVGESVYPPDTA